MRQRNPLRFHLPQRGDARLAVARVAGEPLCAASASVCWLLLGKSERQLGLAEIEQRFGVLRIASQHLIEAQPREIVARALFVARRLDELLRRRHVRRVEFRIAHQVRDAVLRIGMVLEILRDGIAVFVLQHGKVRHHRDHRLRIVAGARHQLQAVAVGLQLVVARDLRHQSRFGQAAELVDERRENRRNSEEDVKDLRLRVGRDDVAAFDVAGFVADDAREFVVRLHEVDQTFVDVDESAHRRE